jgi:Tfp pilus assembly protein PilO
MTRTRKWSVGTAALVVLLIVAGWFLLVAPKKSDADASRASTVSAQAANDQLKTKIAVLTAQQADIPKQQATLATIRLAIPDNPALPSLIRTLNGIAVATGTSFSGLTNATPIQVAQSVTGAAAPAGAAGASTAPGALQLSTVAMSIYGSYAQIELFVAQLENTQRALIVSNVSIKPNQDVNKADYALAATITAKVYNVASSTVTVTPAKTTGSATTTTPNQ